MAQDAYEVSVRIERDTPTLDDYGGETQTESTVASGQIATKHYHSRRDLERVERGPGALTVTDVFFKFERPFPDVRVNDRIVEETALTEWSVKFVRSYARTMQVDCELVS